MEDDDIQFEAEDDDDDEDDKTKPPGSATQRPGATQPPADYPNVNNNSWVMTIMVLTIHYYCLKQVLRYIKLVFIIFRVDGRFQLYHWERL